MSQIKPQLLQWLPQPMFHRQVCPPWHQHLQSNPHEPTRIKNQSIIYNTTEPGFKLRACTQKKWKKILEELLIFQMIH